MKRTIAKQLIATILIMNLAGCATMRRHPNVTTAVIVTVALAGTLAFTLATKPVHCHGTYDGKPYDGTSPGCPKDKPGEPGR